MKPLLRFSVSLWALLVFSALLKICDSHYRECNSTEAQTITTTTTTVNLTSTPNCNLSIGGNSSNNSLITQLTPGKVYEIVFGCLNCSKNVTLKPDAVTDLNVNEITTSSISLTWAKQNYTSYNVKWTYGENSELNITTETGNMNITGLTAGVMYNVMVTPLAEDGLTEGQRATVSNYTKPGIIGHPNVSTTTSSISVTWTAPPGQVSEYRVEWYNSNNLSSINTNDTFAVLSDLIPGTIYTITVFAIAGDKSTEGEPFTLESVTKPDAVRDLTVTAITTSSLSLNWTPPYGSSSFYIVQWSNGTIIENVTQTNIDITGLTAGVRYEISVIAVADDNLTYGQISNVFQYTKPGIIGHPNVSTTTSSISLDWTPPYGEVFKYRVEWNNGGVPVHRYTNDSAAVLSELIPGTNYTITIFAVNRNDTTGDPYTLTSVTEPDVVRSLSITSIATTSVSLAWTEPVGNATSYTVQWTPGEGEDSTNATSFTIEHLSPGFHYNITVAAVAEDSTGKGSSVTTFTWPDQPEDIISTAPGTRNLNISWTLPKGRVDHYVVNISNAELDSFNSHTTTDNMTSFTDLKPGRVFDVTVTAVAGSFFNTSDQTSHATRPIPPDSIIISQRTNSSLWLNWPIPELMAGAPNITYYITYQVETREVQSTTNVSNIWLSSLSSGTYYNISLVTGGPQNLMSTPVYNSSYTEPNPVLNLIASPKSTTSVEVKWSYPHEAKSYYKYRIHVFNSTATINITEIDSTNETVIGNLEPGTGYGINVTTIASEGFESTEEETSSYTMPKAVTNLIAEFVTTTDIKLTWLRQNDHKPSYSYEVIALLGATMVKNGTTKNETYTFSGLTPGTLYTFKVFTVVEEVKSTVESTEKYTKPEAVSNITVIGSTTNLSVHWTPASGVVAFYTVLVYRDSQLVKNSTNLSNNTENKLFLDLMPGVRYCVMVVTKSGPLETNSLTVCNATFPNPPGAIMVHSQTVESINFTWLLPEGMDHNQYNFSVSTFNGSFPTENNWFLLDNLQSGTPYNISVVTVGLQNYESTAVTAENYTRPYPVTELKEAGITTDEVILRWKQPEHKPHYSYLVQTSNSSISEIVSVTMSNITGLNSGTNYSFTVITHTADGTQSAPVTVSYFTRPYAIGQLVAETLNTTAVRLVWAKPFQYKAEYTYQVETTGFDFQNITIKEEVATVSELTPGANYTFCILVIAADGIKGAPICTSQYTKPETVQPSVSSQGSNSSILVSWAKPPGRVEYYMVHLNGTVSKQVSSNNTYWLFEDLSAGRLYTAIVTTFSGPFNASSEVVTNATFPNAPGLIEILIKTVSSIEIRWEEPPLMTDASFKYLLSNISQGDKYVPSTTVTHNFTSLLSGTSYNISVATVGPMDFQKKVEIYKVTSRPFSVNNLNTDTSDESIRVKWTKPDQYKESYRFSVTWGGESKITEELMYDIGALDPGTRYNFSVTTETSDGTKGASRRISSCTNASPVKDFQCKGPNEENAEIMLFWKRPKGRHSGFNITVNDGEIINTLNTCCNHTVSNLRHYTTYKLKVVTLSCGQPSSSVIHECRTGITFPPVAQNYKSLSQAKDLKYDSFYVYINSSLLNGTNGPITNVGVLVTDTDPSVDSSQLRKYLVNNYEEWKGNKVPVYLATVKTNPFKSRSQDNNLPIHIGDGDKQYSYTNGHLDAKGTYRYAIVMFTKLVWTNNEVDIEKSLVAITGFYPAVVLPNNPAVIGIAVGATFGIFCVLFIILIGFIIYWKRVSKKENTDIQIHSMRAKVSVAVRVEDYEAYYKKQKADSNCGFAEEFEDLKLVGTAQAKTNALNVDNKPKNRYNNVLPYDSSRVKLSIIHGSPCDDYINANYMPGYNSRKEFIAAQGPLPVTVKDFWRMVWEKNVQTLVMLTRCNEQGRVKCEKYWDYGTKHFENITVTTTSEIPLEDWTIRDFDIKNVKTAETRSVRHFHFTAWPDHGVPETTELLISFRHLVREHMDQYSRHSPAVVHCSAGVGRTGTFIAIDRLLFQIERENIVDVYGIVHDLRMHRPLMVQTEDQYIFLNQCAMDIIRSRTGTNVDLIYQNTAALSIYENVERKNRSPKNGYHDA